MGCFVAEAFSWTVIEAVRHEGDVLDEADRDYQKTIGYLENADGSTRLPGVGFFVLKLGVAMKNAHHDEPGFWERWAEEF